MRQKWCKTTRVVAYWARQLSDHWDLLNCLYKEKKWVRQSGVALTRACFLSVDIERTLFFPNIRETNQRDFTTQKAKHALLVVSLSCSFFKWVSSISIWGYNRIFRGAEKSCPCKAGDPPAHVSSDVLLWRGRNHQQQKGCCLLANILLSFGDALVPWLVGLQAVRIIQAGSNLGGSPAQSPPQSRDSCEVRPGCSWLLPAGAWNSKV